MNPDTQSVSELEGMALAKMWDVIKKKIESMKQDGKEVTTQELMEDVKENLTDEEQSELKMILEDPDKYEKSVENINEHEIIPKYHMELIDDTRKQLNNENTDEKPIYLDEDGYVNIDSEKVDINRLNQVQMVDKETGNVISATLENNNSEGIPYFKNIDNQDEIGLQQASDKGQYKIIGVQYQNDKFSIGDLSVATVKNKYNSKGSIDRCRIEETNDKKFHVVDNNSSVLSKRFETNEQAQDFMTTFLISETLNDNKVIDKEVQKQLDKRELEATTEPITKDVRLVTTNKSGLDQQMLIELKDLNEENLKDKVKYYSLDIEGLNYLESKNKAELINEYNKDPDKYAEIVPSDKDIINQVENDLHLNGAKYQNKENGELQFTNNNGGKMRVEIDKESNRIRIYDEYQTGTNITFNERKDYKTYTFQEINDNAYTKFVDEKVISHNKRQSSVKEVNNSNESEPKLNKKQSYNKEKDDTKESVLEQQEDKENIIKKDIEKQVEQENEMELE